MSDLATGTTMYVSHHFPRCLFLVASFLFHWLYLLTTKPNQIKIKITAAFRLWVIVLMALGIGSLVILVFWLVYFIKRRRLANAQESAPLTQPVAVFRSTDSSRMWQ